MRSSGQLARALRRFFYVEFSLYLVWAVLSLYRGDSLLNSLFWPLFTWFTIRVVMVLKNFVQCELNRSPRSPEERLGVWGIIRLFWGELWITLRTYSFYFPFEQQFVDRHPKTQEPHQGLPIVLVPGFACNRGYYGNLRRWLAQAGYNHVYAVTLEPVFGSIEANAQDLAQQIEDICLHSGSQQVILIAHSMGGLTTRVYVHDLNGAQRVAKIISLGAPHKGTIIAKGMEKLGRDLEQMLPNGEWQQTFNEHTENSPCPVNFVNVVTPHDNIVAPQHNCRLNPVYGKQVVLPGIGHLEMIASKPVFKVILDELKLSANKAV